MVSWILILGCDFRNVCIVGNNIVFAVCFIVVICIVLDGWFCRLFRDVMVEFMLCNIGLRIDKRCLFVLVGIMLCVVCVRSCNFNCFFIWCIIWFKVDCVMFRWAAVWVKLCFFVMMINVIRLVIFLCFI